MSCPERSVAADDGPNVRVTRAELRGRSGLRGKIDTTCKDCSRLYYLPAHRPRVEPVFYHNRGELLSLPTVEHWSLRSLARPVQLSGGIKAGVPVTVIRAMCA